MGTDDNTAPTACGLLSTLTAKQNSKATASTVITSGKGSVTGVLKQKYVRGWESHYQRSPMYYPHSVMGKLKYRAMQKARCGRFEMHVAVNTADF